MSVAKSFLLSCYIYLHHAYLLYIPPVGPVHFTKLQQHGLSFIPLHNSINQVHHSTYSTTTAWPFLYSTSQQYKPSNLHTYNTPLTPLVHQQVLKMPRLCRECGGSSFTVEMGVKMCNQCGMEQVGYMELLSQEAINMVDVSRMTVTKGRGMEHDTSDDEHEKSMDSNDNDKTGKAGMQVLKLLRMIKFGLILFIYFLG